MSKGNLLDIWRIQHENRKRFTWRLDKPCRASRLDYFLILEEILSLNPKSEILNAYRSDHNIIKLSINKSGQKRGKGLWKFNNALLENLEFVDMIKSELSLVSKTYALPVYSEAFVESDNGQTLDISISSTLFLETLLCQLRGKMIKFSKNLKRQETEAEDTLVTSIKELQAEIDSDNENIVKKNSLRDLSLQLENLREKKIKGCIIRSRASLTDNWEKPSKYFLNLEKRNHVNKNIPSLIDGDTEIIDSAKILTLQRDFYADLYSSKDTIPLNDSEYANLLQNLLQLENLREKKIKGCIIHSRASLTDNWEKPSKYFLNLEKRNHVNKNIPSLIDGDTEIIDSAKILTLQRDFYADLYSSKDTIPLNDSEYANLLQNLPKLSENDKNRLETPYSLDELQT